MTPEVIALIAATVLGCVGIALVVGTLIPSTGRSDDEVEAEREGRRPRRRTRTDLAAPVGIGLVVALVVLAFSGWIVPAALSGAFAFAGVRTWQRRDRRARREIEYTDALASWIENLRDVLLAGDQPIGAIAATVPSTPAIIRPHVRRLSAALAHQSPDTAIRRFADDVDDPLGDLVAAGLLIAVQRGARTVVVLSSLAEQARSQADRRRVVEAERAPVRREVSMLTFIMGSLVIGVLVFGRADYLSAYDTTEGQLFLAVILGAYALLLVRVQRLSRDPRPRRFLTTEGHSRDDRSDVAAPERVRS